MRWQDLVCQRCGGKITDRANAYIDNDITTGGLKGMHIACPTPPVVPDFDRGWDACVAAVRAIHPEIADQLVKA